MHATHDAAHEAIRPTLVVVAHGSRDPRHAATVTALAARVRTLRPYLRVECAYLDFNAPSVPRLLERLHYEGVRDVVALPLLLGRAFHAKVDIPAVLREATARLSRAPRLSRLPRLHVRQAEVLGPHPLLVRALERRLLEAGLGLGLGERRSTGIVLASAGSSDPEANAVIARTAREWRRTAGWCAVRPAFASASSPCTADAVRGMRADGIERVAVAPYVIAPGRLPDRIRTGALEAGADVLAPVLGAAEELAALLALRYDEAVADRGPVALPA